MRIQTIDPEHSVSFAVADEVRKAVLRPWMLPLLPLNIPKRITKRKIRTVNHRSTFVDAVVVIDSEAIRDVDLRVILAGLRKSFNSVALALIGTVNDVVADLQLPRKGDKSEVEAWNKLVCTSVLHLVRTRSPEHVIYIGKFPHGGIRRIGSRIIPKGQLSWLAVRSDDSTISKHASSFRSVVSYNQKNPSNVANIWVDDALPVSWSIKNRTDDINTADVLVVPSGDLPLLRSWLSEGRVVVMVENGKKPSVLGFEELAGLRLIHLDASDEQLEVHLRAVMMHLKKNGQGPALRSAIHSFRQLTLP